MAKSLSLSLIARVTRIAITDDYGGSSIADIVGDLSLTYGTGANQADTLYVARRKVTSSGSPDVLDLAGGSLTGFGPNGSNSAISFAKLAAMVVFNRDATNVLTVGGGSNAVAGIGSRLVGPGDVDFMTRRAVAGVAVTAGTGDLIQVATSGGANVPYDIILVGRSA